MALWYTSVRIAPNTGAAQSQFPVSPESGRERMREAVQFHSGGMHGTEGETACMRVLWMPGCRVGHDSILLDSSFSAVRGLSALISGRAELSDPYTWRASFPAFFPEGKSRKLSG